MIEYSLRALEAASSSSNDRYDLAITIIGIICLLLNLIGFLLFYFNTCINNSQDVKEKHK